MLAEEEVEEMGEEEVEEMTEEEIEEMRTRECIEVTVQGDITEMYSIEKLEKKVEQECHERRINVPNTDILQHQARRGLPLHVTCPEAAQELTEQYEKIMEMGRVKIDRAEDEIQREIAEYTENGNNIDETTKNIANLVNDILTVNPPYDETRKRLEKEIMEALKKLDDSIGTTINVAMKKILHENTERYLLKENKATKGKLAALENRRGQIGENQVMAAMNQLMEEFLGMSVMGMKTHTFLYNFVERLNIKLTHRNTMNRENGRMEHVGHDHISTWLEEDMLVVNFVVPSVLEQIPWSTNDQVTKGQAAAEKAKLAIEQLKKDHLTFIEMFPDISTEKRRKIRLIILDLSHIYLCLGFSSLYLSMNSVAMSGVSKMEQIMITLKVKAN